MTTDRSEQVLHECLQKAGFYANPIRFKPDETLSGLNSELWSEDYGDSPAFFRAVEHSESFAALYTQDAAIDHRLYLEQL